MDRNTKQLLFLIVVLLILGAAIVMFLAGASEQVVPRENGSIIVTFCPECKEAMLSELQGGGSIVCALYDVGKETGSVLQQKGASVLTDDETKPYLGTPYVHSGLMHNKFCVINNSEVLSGSYNPTDGGERNQNNFLVIHSETLAKNYQKEYQALASKTKRGEIKHKVYLNDVLVENYFCPEDSCEQQVLATLASAKHSVLFLTFSFTSDKIGALLAKKQQSGITVEGWCDKGQDRNFSECSVLHAKDWTGGGLLHHKVFIIDNNIVITGSYNPTASGTARNNENILIIHDQAIANQFTSEYLRINASVR